MASFPRTTALILILGCALTAHAQESKPPEPVPAKQGGKQQQPPPPKKSGARFGVEAASVAQLPSAVSVDSAQGGISSASSESNTPPAPDEQADARRGEFVWAPIPISSPGIGTGLVFLAGYVFRLNPEDKLSPPTIAGGAVMATSNGSWAVAGGAKLYMKKDRFRLAVGGGRGDVNYELFGIGSGAGDAGRSVEINQSGSAIFFEFLTRTKWKVFVGPRYQYRNLTARLPVNQVPPIPVPPAAELRSQTAAFGFRIQQDRRNETFYPRTGSLLDFTADFFRDVYGSKFNYQSFAFSYNHYKGLSPRQVLAFRFAGCAVTGQVPFYDLCLFGSHSDLRGYQSGQYRDRALFATQAEYRLQLPYRLGLVAFGGVGEVAPGWDDFTADNLLPGGGVGVRLAVSKKYKINFRVDYGWGKNGGTLHIGVSEAF